MPRREAAWLLATACLCGLALAPAAGSGRSLAQEAAAPAAPAAAAAPAAPQVTDTADLSFTVGGKPAGVVTVGLFGNEFPDSAAAFLSACKGFDPAGCSYAGSLMRRAESWIVQGGDCINKNGTGGWDLFKNRTRDANLTLPVTRGSLAWGMPLPKIGGTEFFFSPVRSGFLDNKTAVFGRVLSGLDLIDQFTKVPTVNTTKAPVTPVRIVSCQPSTTPFATAVTNATNTVLSRDQLTVTRTADLDVSVGDQRVGVISIGLLGNAAPNTVAKFEAICAGLRPGCKYTGSRFTRAVADFMLQGGDCSADGSGGWGAFADAPADSASDLLPVEAGSVAMAAPADWTSGSQFFIPFADGPWLEGQHVVFGRVLSGLDLVRTLANSTTDDAGAPKDAITINACRLNGDSGKPRAANNVTFTEAAPAFAANASKEAPPVALDPMGVTNKVLLDVEMDGKPAGTIQLGLFGHEFPDSVAAFLAACKGDDATSCDFSGTPFHRISPSSIVGGDCINKNGTGGMSLFATRPKDATTTLAMDQGALAWAAPLPKIGGSQFMIAPERDPYLDNKRIVFGRVLSGMDLVEAMSNTRTDNNGKPSRPVVLKACRVDGQRAQPPATLEEQAVKMLASVQANPLLANATRDTTNTAPMFTHTAEMAFKIAGQPAGVVTYGLYGNVAPTAVTNFVTLCNGNFSNNATFPPYEGVNIPRVVKGFVLQGGGCCTSIYGKPFFNEVSPALKHNAKGIVNMANSGGNQTNYRQFAIMMAATPWLDGKHTIFARVLSGMDVLDVIQNLPTDRATSRPLSLVTVDRCWATPVAPMWAKASPPP